MSILTVNDPNRPDDPLCTLRLIGKVTCVSLGTTKSADRLSELGIAKKEKMEKNQVS